MNARRFSAAEVCHASTPGVDQDASKVRARRMILILGMHRSGTSALARLLGLCGAALPPQPTSDSHESNPLGHWESQRIVDVHNSFLRMSGTSWDDILSYPKAMFSSDTARAYQRRLINTIRKEYGDADLFVLKDPRTSRLMPLWLPILKSLDVVPLVIIPVRNPLEVADSLRKRNGWDQHRALLVWMRYMLSAERESRHVKRCFVRYDQLIEIGEPLLRRYLSGLISRFRSATRY